MTTIQVRTDPQLKREAQKMLKIIGLDMSSAINIYLRQITLTGSIPFELRTTSGFTRAQLRQMDREVKWALKHGKRYNSGEELMRDILGNNDYEAWKQESAKHRRNKTVPERYQAPKAQRLRSGQARHGSGFTCKRCAATKWLSKP